MEAERALRDLNETLEQRVEAEARERARIWNVSQDMLVVADIEGRYLNVNPAWTATLGWSEADLVGNTSEWLRHPDDRERTRAELARLADGFRTMQFENRLRHKRGTYCWLSWTAVPDGGFIYAVARDVTEIKNAEEQLRASRRELAKVSHQTTMGAMTASIAHEVNQPLTGISTRASAALRWMRADKPDFQKVADALEHIVAASHRAADVVAGVRAMFKKDSSQRLPTDVNGLILTVLSIVRIELEQCKVDVQTHFDEQLPIVQGDKVQLQQVVLNLIMNAIDAMQLVHWRALNVRTQANAGKVIVSIEDTGIGIDTSKLDQIFKPLFTSKASGMGMGLAICQSIIESHDGRIWASPAATRGSIFQFELPTNLDNTNTAT
jgi:PAS domain S-box-containing protein